MSVAHKRPQTRCWIVDLRTGRVLPKCELPAITKRPASRHVVLVMFRRDPSSPRAWWATSSDHPGAVGHGPSRDTALRALRSAVRSMQRRAARVGPGPVEFIRRRKGWYAIHEDGEGVARGRGPTREAAARALATAPEYGALVGELGVYTRCTREV